MLLKRIYKRGTQPLELDYVSLANTGVEPQQNFSTGLIYAAIAEGWCTIGHGKLTLHLVPEDLVYTVNRVPGRYCCHCSEKLPDDATGEGAREHIRTVHPGVESPDPAHPAGYLMTNAFECVLDAVQHEKYRVKKPGKPPVFPRRKEPAHG